MPRHKFRLKVSRNHQPRNRRAVLGFVQRKIKRPVAVMAIVLNVVVICA
jgi:hypothetical protein